MKVIVVGAGLGGLACAIACRRANLDVTVLEKSPEISPIGAGIQIPPNGARIMDELCLLPELLEKGTVVETIDIRRYADGKIITSMPSGEILIPEYGAPWIIIHRADYHEILLARAKALGAKIRLSATVKDVVYESPQVILAGGERIAGDVIIGADGLGSTIRNCILGEEHPPDETGDLAYRGTFSREQLESLADTDINHLCARMAITSWLGPKKHAVFYPLRGGKEYNLVLIRPDDMPLGVHNAWSDLVEVQHAYKGWDRTLQKIISCIPSMLKWKLCHLPELRTWTKGSVTLLGDACHPTLPYQAQGAAMAVEDGAVLGILLDAVASRSASGSSETMGWEIQKALQLYEAIRRPRTAQNVQGAVRNRGLFHLDDGALQWLRDLLLKISGMTWETDWGFIMSYRYRQMIGFDVLQDAEARISGLRKGKEMHSHQE